MKKILLIITLSLITTNSYAEWRLIGKVVEATFYVEINSLRYRGNSVKFWELVDYYAVTSGILSTKGQWEHNCETEESRLLTGTAYSGAMGSGTVIQTFSDTKQWTPVTPGTIEDVTHKFVCKKN